MKKIIFILSSYFFISSLLFSQSLPKVTISGSDHDASNSKPIQFVNEDSLLMVGDSLFSTERYIDAKNVYESILKNTNQLIKIYSRLGKVAIATKKWNEVNEYFDKVLEIDPENFEAYYYKAIMYREKGKRNRLLLRALAWNKSEKYFQRVISDSSLFKDVLFQYAILNLYKNKFREAIELCHQQILSKPELHEPQIELYCFYRFYIHDKKLKKVIKWLRSKPWEQAEYFCGEKYRYDGKIEIADSIFRKLISLPLQTSKQPIYLSLARIYYQQKKTGIAEKYVMDAIQNIQTKIDADLVLQDMKYIMTDDELRQYNSLNLIPELIDFFTSFWIRRNPIPVAEINDRLTEHYQRLLYAEKYYEYDFYRTKFDKSEKFDLFKYPDFFSSNDRIYNKRLIHIHHGKAPEVYSLNKEFNDKGLIYIRHGKPDEIARTLGEETPLTLIPPNESWLYYKQQNRPKMIFHFQINETVSIRDWRFSPTISKSLMKDRRGWYKSIHPWENMLEEMEKISEKSIDRALSTDSHQWAEEIEPLLMPIATATFRGDKETTFFEFYSAIPVDFILDKVKLDTNGLEFEKGLTIHNTDWHLIAKAHKKIVIPETITISYLDYYRFPLAPGTYNISYFGKPVKSHLLAVYKFEKNIEDYSSVELNMSEIQLALKIEPTTKDDMFVKHGLRVIPNPTFKFNRKNPVYLYFEIYNLSLDSENKTQFSLEYTLEKIKAEDNVLKKMFRIFSSGQTAISLTTEREGNNELSIEHLALDVRNVKPGDYKLKIKVIDKLNNSEISKTIQLYLM